jgi:hypothetical protein
MPFDFKKFQHYSINYSELFAQLNSKKILNDSNIQANYLLLWLKYLSSYDQNNTNKLNDQRSIIEMQLKLQSEREIFQCEINYTGMKILLHFRISIANEILLPFKSQSQLIPVDEFISDDSEFKWTPVDTNVDSYLYTDDPIIIVPFLNGTYNYLVIDGNHRLTSKIKHNKENINAIVISEQTVIEQSLFSSGFDKYYYIMNNELERMAYQTHIKKINANEIVQKSFLNGGCI